MARCYRYITPYLSIFWTKRYVRYRPAGIRGNLRRLRLKNRIHKRPILLLIKYKMQSRRKKYNPFKPQRRNYNTVYGRMQIPV